MMFAHSSFEKCYFFVLAFVAGTVFVSDQAFATSCQVYPSEYAYRSDSVYRTERSSANCRRYLSTIDQSGALPEQYTHCDGTQLRLTDSDLGSEQYNSSEYYEWITESGRQLLFIFPTRVNLTTITLHYYRDSDRGLPRLRFYAVSDDFNVWDVLTASYSHVDVAAVPPGGEPAGHRNVSIHFNFNTKRILMYKYRSDFEFAVSEVEFFVFNVSTTITEPYSPTTTSSQLTPSTALNISGFTSTTHTTVPQMFATTEFLNSSMDESGTSSGSSVNLREGTAWILVVMVTLLNVAFAMEMENGMILATKVIS